MTLKHKEGRTTEMVVFLETVIEARNNLHINNSDFLNIMGYVRDIENAKGKSKDKLRLRLNLYLDVVHRDGRGVRLPDLEVMW